MPISSQTVSSVKLLFDSVQQPVCLLTHDLKILWHNQAAEREMQVLRSPDGLLSILPWDAAQQAADKLKNKQEVILSGEQIPLLLNTIRLVPLTEEENAALAFFTLSRSEAGSIYPTDTCGRFSATFEEKFRFPLSAIFASLDVLTREKSCRKPQITDKLSYIMQQSYQLLRTNLLMSEYMKYTYGSNPLKLAEADMDSFCEKLVSQLKIFLPQDADISYHFEGEDSAAVIDVEKISILIASLWDNSCTFRREEPLRLEFKCEVSDKRVSLILRDNGKGIPDEIQPKVFQPFYSYTSETMPFAGNGLGLSLCKLIAQQHGGMVLLASKQGEGTTVTVTFPRKLSDSAEVWVRDSVLQDSYHERFTPFSVIMMGSKPKLPQGFLKNE